MSAQQGEKPELTPELEHELKVGTAIQKAILAVMLARREEILTLARTELTALGVPFRDEEMEIIK